MYPVLQGGQEVIRMLQYQENMLVNHAAAS